MKRHCQSSGDGQTPIVKKPSSDNVADVGDKILQAVSELVEKVENILTTAKEHVDGEPWKFYFHSFKSLYIYT